MAIILDNPEADRLARELAAATGESVTDAVMNAVRERLDRQRRQTPADRLREELLAIGRRCASLPVEDVRRPDEILGYDDDGLPR